MGNEKKSRLELHVPNSRFPCSLDEEGLVNQIISGVGGIGFDYNNFRWSGEVDMGSGRIGMFVYGGCPKDIVVGLFYGPRVIRRHLSRIRRVLGEIGFAKE